MDSREKCEPMGIHGPSSPRIYNRSGFQIL